MRSPFVFALILVATSGAIRGDDPEPIQAKLTAAQKKYDEAIAKFREQVGVYFDKREEVARQAANKKLVDQIKAERMSFETTDNLPPNTPLVIKQARGSAAKDLELAYSAAAKEFLKAKKDDQADFADRSAACLRQYGVLLPDWGVAFPPGIYVVLYAKKNRALLEIRPNRTFSRNKEGKDFSHGTFEVLQGKLILRNSEYVTVVTKVGGNFTFDHFFPAKNYPNGKSEAGTMTRHQ